MAVKAKFLSALQEISEINANSNSDADVMGDALNKISAITADVLNWYAYEQVNLNATVLEIKLARDLHTSESVEIDDNSASSRSEDGVWVSGWVWVGPRDSIIELVVDHVQAQDVQPENPHESVMNSIVRSARALKLDLTTVELYKAVESVMDEMIATSELVKS